MNSRLSPRSGFTVHIDICDVAACFPVGDWVGGEAEEGSYNYRIFNGPLSTSVM